MRQRWFLALAGCLFLPSTLFAQDARSLGLGGAATAAPTGIFCIYWNPAFLGIPSSTDVAKKDWVVGSGYSIFDSSNTGAPILRYNNANALASGKATVSRGLNSLGIVAVKYSNGGGGVLYQQDLSTSVSNGALQFFKDRDGATLTALPYALNFLETQQQIASLIVSYGSPFPLGNMPVFVGGSLKYHTGLYYSRTTLNGTFTQGSAWTETYDRVTSNSGLGFSVDASLLAKVSDALQVGLMFQNLKSDFNWEATQQAYSLDPNTGLETPSGSAQAIKVASPFPYALKLGLTAAPQDKNIIISGEVSWSQDKTRWKAGVERLYPETHLAVRFGTFADDVSGEQLWTFGGGYLDERLILDLAFVTRNLPAIQDSLALGGAINGSFRF